jgi:hypothetical protein
MLKRKFEPRQREHKIAAPDNSRKRIIAALEETWENGGTFMIHANTEGRVEVVKNRTRLFAYDDIGQLLAALFPDYRR